MKIILILIFFFSNNLLYAQNSNQIEITTEEGIEVFNQNAGEGKDLFNPFRRPRSDEIKHLQNIVDDIYIDHFP